MNRLFFCRMALACWVVLLISALSAAQDPATGLPPLGAFSGGPDIVDLANLNVHLSIPVFSRAGKGLPFNYNLLMMASYGRRLIQALQARGHRSVTAWGGGQQPKRLSDGLSTPAKPTPRAATTTTSQDLKRTRIQASCTTIRTEAYTRSPGVSLGEYT